MNSFLRQAKSQGRLRRWGLFGLFALLIVSCGALAASWLAARADRELRAGLLSHTRLIADSVDLADVRALTGTEADLTAGPYLRIKEWLMMLHKANPDCRFLYLMARRPDGSVVLLVDSEPAGSPDYSPPGDVYVEVTPEERRVFETCEAVAIGPFENRWGTWMAAQVPLLAEGGSEPAAVLGRDIEASTWSREVAQRSLLPAGIATLALLFPFLAGAFFFDRRAVLHFSQKRFDQLAEQSRTFIWEVDADGLFTYVSPVVGPVLGYRESELVGRMHFYDLHPEDGREAFLAGARSVFDAKQPFRNLENPVVTKGGKLLWFSTNGLPLLNPDGSLRGYRGSDTDITERRQAEAAAQQEQALAQTIILSIPGTFYMIGADGRYLSGNDCQRDEIVGPERRMTETLAADTIHPDDRAFIVEKITSVLTTGNEESAEARVLLRGGPDFRWFLMTGRRLMIQGSPVLIGIGIDISARKQIEESLVLVMDRLQLAARAGGVGMWDYDVTAGRLVWDDQMAALYGIDRNSFSGAFEAWRDAVHPEDQLRMRREIERALQGGNDLDTEFRVVWPDGTIRDIRALARVHRSATGQPLRMVGTNWDITDRKRMEESLRDALNRAESASRAKSEFLAVMSHELRTPLNGILGFAELLAGTRLDAEQVDYARTITNSGEHLLSIVNDILDFSTIEEGRLVLESGPVAIADVVDSSCLSVRTAASGKGLAFHVEIAPDVPPTIAGDARRIRQILINLLGNAVKFTAEGSVRFRVSLATDAGRQALEFSVEDTGIGIAPATVERIFEPFTQGDSTLHRSFEGTGMGLAISKRLAEAMGGTLHVASEPGKGSLFTFRLPLHEAGLRPDAPARPPAPAAASSPAGRPVLVVEDDRDNSRLAGSMLKSLGFRAEFAFDGQQALSAFVPEKFFAILMDVQMPVMNGIEAARKIRGMESGPRVPIIALTANVMPGDRERCLASGMDDFISKPFRREDLAAKLQALGKA